MKLTLSLLWVPFLFLPVASTAQPNAVPAARSIAENYVRARGGMEKLMRIRSVILRGPTRANGRPGRYMAKARPHYFRVGDPAAPGSFAEGFDGSSWEYYANPGLVMRTEGEPAAASRHTSYFDDPIIKSITDNWPLEVLGKTTIGTRPAYRLLAVYPDSFRVEYFVDTETWLVIANRKAAPIHAVGEPVSTETRIGGYREVNGVMFATEVREFVIETGRPLDELGGGWATIEVNADLPPDYFSPPLEPLTPVARTLNAMFASRKIPVDAAAWYRDLRENPLTKDADYRGGVEGVTNQMLKNGAVPAAVRISEMLARDYPQSASGQFALGRAYRASGREADARRHFRQALSLDPSFERAREALK